MPPSEWAVRRGAADPTPDAVGRTRRMLEAADQPRLELQVRVGEGRHPDAKGVQRAARRASTETARQGAAVGESSVAERPAVSGCVAIAIGSPSLTDSLPQRRRAGSTPAARRERFQWDLLLELRADLARLLDEDRHLHRGGDAQLGPDRHPSPTRRQARDARHRVCTPNDRPSSPASSLARASMPSITPGCNVSGISV